MGMTTIVFASSKGGAGKTTAAILLASELAREGMDKNISITLIDADPNQHSVKWAMKDGCPKNITPIAVDEENILDKIENAEAETDFVIVDLEGTASMSVASAISRATLVIVLCQGSQDDADEAAKTIKLIQNQSKILNRTIAYSILMTRTNAAITPRNLTYIINQFNSLNADLFKTSLIEREAFKAIRSFGGTVNDLDKKEVSGIKQSISNTQAFTSEVKEKLKSLIIEKDKSKWVDKEQA